MTPSRRLLYCVFALALLGVAGSYSDAALLAWQASMLAVLLAACIDAALARATPALRVERQLAGVWPVDSWNPVTVSLHNEGTRALHLELHDDYPTAWEMEGLSHASTVAPETVC